MTLMSRRLTLYKLEAPMDDQFHAAPAKQGPYQGVQQLTDMTMIRSQSAGPAGTIAVLPDVFGMSSKLEQLE